MLKNSNWQYDQSNLPASTMYLNYPLQYYSSTLIDWFCESVSPQHRFLIKDNNQGWWWLPNVFIIIVSVNSLSWNKWNTLHVGVTSQVGHKALKFIFMVSVVRLTCVCSVKNRFTVKQAATARGGEVFTQYVLCVSPHLCVLNVV